MKRRTPKRRAGSCSARPAEARRELAYPATDVPASWRSRDGWQPRDRPTRTANPSKYGEVKLPFGGTVGEQAKIELFEMHHLAVGKEAEDIEAKDQDGKPFKLSDYRRKVVLLYFWSEY